jgi:Resolvase, N terminal domain/Helix-turn-helix domain of resolvase
VQPDLPGESQRRAADPARVAADAESPRPRRRGDGNADRPAGALDLRPVCHRQAQIVDAGGQFRSLAEPWADTATSTGRLMISVLGGLADVERDLIRTRTAEGRSRAKARGQHMGRTPKLTPQQQKEARRRRAEGATLKELAKSYNVGRATISRLAAP